MQADKRRYERFSLRTESVSCKIVSATEVKVLNISMTGVALEVNKRLNIGSQYMLGLASADAAVSLKGNVVWSRLTESKQNGRGDIVPIYNSGIQFGHMTTGQSKELENLIAKCSGLGNSGMNMHGLSGLRCAVRYSVDGVDKSVIKTSTACRVKTIGMGGMMMTSSQALEIESRHMMGICLPNGKTVKFLGRIASCLTSAGNNSEHEIGVEFLNMTEEETAALSNFITALKGDSLDN